MTATLVIYFGLRGKDSRSRPRRSAVAETQATLKRIGLTRGKAMLIGVLAIVLVGVVYMQFRSFGAGRCGRASAGSDTPHAPPVQRAAQRHRPQRSSKRRPAGDTQVELLELDQARWKSPELSAVIAYDPFALPAAFPQPPKIGIDAQLADGEVDDFRCGGRRAAGRGPGAAATCNWKSSSSAACT